MQNKLSYFLVRLFPLEKHSLRTSSWCKAIKMLWREWALYRFSIWSLQHLSLPGRCSRVCLRAGFWALGAPEQSDIALGTHFVVEGSSLNCYKTLRLRATSPVKQLVSQGLKNFCRRLSNFVAPVSVGVDSWFDWHLSRDGSFVSTVTFRDETQSDFGSVLRENWCWVLSFLY